jgi:molybdopterin molybdotransferase
VSTPETNIRTYEWQEARKIVIDTGRKLPLVLSTEQVSLADAYGRILADDIAADRDYPALRRSLRDGYAVRSSDLPGSLRVRGEVRAGEPGQGPLESGEALEIMTGAPVPDGADAVLMVEHVTRSSSADGNVQISWDRRVDPGQFINDQGAESHSGDKLLLRGVFLDASHIATLAMVGKDIVPAVKRPSVAVLATGDELVEVEEPAAPYQIRNSNSHMLAALIRSAGGTPHILPVARDTEAALRLLLEEGLKHDMLVISGGVSAGRYDLVKPTLRTLGAEFHFERVRIQPGGPASFATVSGKPVFGLPGNPGSSLVTFQLFARPALELLAGVAEPILPMLWARFAAPFHHKLGLTRFLPARLSVDGESLTHIPWQGSSDIPALARANAFLVANHDRESWAAGDLIHVMPKL